MNIGFIGSGKIASSVITGIFKSNIIYKKIIISSRNQETSEKLKKI
jgi:pyrroline-5-carboxylate reductase